MLDFRWTTSMGWRRVAALPLSQRFAAPWPVMAMEYVWVNSNGSPSAEWVHELQWIGATGRAPCPINDEAIEITPCLITVRPVLWHGFVWQTLNTQGIGRVHHPVDYGIMRFSICFPYSEWPWPWVSPNIPRTRSHGKSFGTTPGTEGSAEAWRTVPGTLDARVSIVRGVPQASIGWFHGKSIYKWRKAWQR